MKFKGILTIFIFVLGYRLSAQIAGGTNPGQSIPKEIKASELTKGGFNSDVSLFTGALSSSYQLGSVKTLAGLTFNLTLSYAGNKIVGNNLPVATGIPYGEGWNLNLPTISLTAESYRNLTQAQISAILANTPPSLLFNKQQARKEGELYWLAPFISIPGIISERFVLKNFDIAKNEAIFVPNKFEKLVEARLNGAKWTVTLENGDQYKFDTQMLYSYRNPSGLKLNVDSLRHDEMSMDASLLPEEEILTWYCSAIYNKNSPQNQQITFHYEYFGIFDYYKEFFQPKMLPHYSEAVGLLAPQSIPKFKACKDILLTKVISSSNFGEIERIELNYKTFKPVQSKNLLSLGSAGVYRKDSLYNYSVVYSEGLNSNGNDSLKHRLLNSIGDATPALSYNTSGNTGNYMQHNSSFSSSWRRYRHVYQDTTLVNQNINIHDNNFASSTDPYLFANNGNPAYKYSNTGGTSEIAFDHCYLESPKMNLSDGADAYHSQYVPGDVYEFRTLIHDISSAPANSAYLPKNFDINIVTGSGSEIGSGSNVYPADYSTGTRGFNVFNTFRNPVKWTRFGKSIPGDAGTPTPDPAYFTTSNVFVMPQLPKGNGGLYFQIGPANSDHQFDLQLENINVPKMPGQPFDNSVYRAYDYYFFGPNTTGKIRSLNPHYKPGNNFGIGAPWYMMSSIYSNRWSTSIGNDNDTSFIAYPNAYNRFWFNAKRGQPSIWNNMPTSADANIKLSAIQLLRYSKNTYMLVNVKKYVSNGYPLVDRNNGLVLLDSITLSYKNIIDTLYDVREFQSFNTTVSIPNDTVLNCTSYSGGANFVKVGTKNFRKAGYQNVVLLTSITSHATNGVNRNSSFSPSSTPPVTTTFNYGLVKTDSLFFNDPYGPLQGQFTGHFHPLVKITDHLGGITSYKYYPINSLNASWDNMYDFDYYAASSGYNYNMGITLAYRATPMVKEKILYNSATDSITTKVWQYIYDPCKSIIIKTPNLNSITNSKFTRERVDSDFGFKKTTVKHPKLSVNETKVPYEVYTHYTTESSNLLFGKLNKIESFDANGVLLKKQLFERRADTAYFNWMTGRRTFFPISSLLTYVVGDYVTPNSLPTTKPDIAITTPVAKMHFAETMYNNLFKDDSCGIKHYLNSYFVKLVKETSTSYDHSIKTKKKPYVTGTVVEHIPVGTSVTGRLIAGNANMTPLITEGYGSKKSVALSLTGINAILITDSIQNTTEYVYWDANPYGKTTCAGFKLLKELNSPSPYVYSNQLQFEPSWQLYMKKSYSPQHPAAYTTDEYFYYYDLIQNVYQNPYSLPPTYDYITRPDSFDALYLTQHYRIRNLSYQKRTLLKNAYKPAVINSEYYWYDAAAKSENCGFAVKTITVSKTPCSTWGNGLTDSTQVDTVLTGNTCLAPYVGCYSVSISPWNGREIIAPDDDNDDDDDDPDPAPWPSYQTNCDGNIITWYCPPLTGESSTNKEIQKCTEKYKLKLKNVYKQCDTLVANVDTLTYRVTGTNPIEFNYLNDYGWTTNLKTTNIARFKYYKFVDMAQPLGHKYQNNYLFSLPYKVYSPVSNYDFNELGLLKKTVDQRGLVKEMTYDQGYAVLIKNTSCPAWTWLTFNSLFHKYGQPNKIKIYDKNQPGSNKLEFEYLFNPDLSVDTILENNNRFTSYQYDYFGRMKTSLINGDTVSITKYEYWNGDTSKTFVQRASENYVETTLFNDKLNPVVETSRAYVDPLGRKFDVAVYADPNYYNSLISDTIMIHSGTTSFDNWGRVLKQYKPFIYRNSTPNTNVSFTPRFSNPGGAASEQRYENNQRGNVLRATKFGENINTGKKVLSTYNIINGWDLSQELNNTSLLIELTSTNQPNIWVQYRFLKTAVMDEDGKKTVTYTDALGKKVAVKTYSDAFTSQLTYYVYGSHFKPTLIKNPNGQNTTYMYDYNGNVELEKSVDADTVTYVSKPWGDVIKAQCAAQKNSLPYKYHTTYRHDAFGKVVLETVNRADSTSILNDAITSYIGGALPNGFTAYPSFLPIQYPSKTQSYFNKSWNYLFNTEGRLCAQTRSDSANNTPYYGVFYSYNNKGLLEREITFTLLKPAYPSTEIFSVIRYTKYNLRNSLLEKEIDADGDSIPEKIINYEYDAYNRLTTVKVNNSTIATYSYYDDQGLVKKITHRANVAGSNVIIDTLVHYYDVRNRLTNINSKLYKEALYYDNSHPQITGVVADTAFLVSASANFNGNINAIKHTVFNPTNSVPQSIMDSATIYGYNYDGINRLIKADATVKNLLSNPSAYNAARQVGDESYIYDNIGNISNIKRGLYFSTPQSNYTTQMNYSYVAGKNQLVKTDSFGVPKYRYLYNMSGSQRYQYDSLRKETYLTYYRNTLSQLPDREVIKKVVHISHSSYDTNYIYINYLYNTRNERIGKFIYENPGTMMAYEGTYYLTNNGGTTDANVNIDYNGLTPWTYNYYGRSLICVQDSAVTQYSVRDHLGSVRLRYIKDSTQPNLITLSEAYDYTPYGTVLRQYQYFMNKIKQDYIGREKDQFTGMNYFGARMYQSRIARWGVVDPLKDKYPNFSPYNYGACNPIFFKDVDGRDIIVYDSDGKAYKYTVGATGASGSKYVQETFSLLNKIYDVNEAPDGGGPSPKEMVDKFLTSKNNLYLTSFKQSDYINKKINANGSFDQDITLSTFGETSMRRGVTPGSGGNARNGYVKFNPFIGVTLVDSYGMFVIRSAAGILAHEIRHAFNSVTNLKQQEADSKAKDPNFMNVEQKKAVDTENKVAEFLGEMQRLSEGFPIPFLIK